MGSKLQNHGPGRKSAICHWRCDRMQGTTYPTHIQGIVQVKQVWNGCILLRYHMETESGSIFLLCGPAGTTSNKEHVSSSVKTWWLETSTRLLQQPLPNTVAMTYGYCIRSHVIRDLEFASGSGAGTLTTTAYYSTSWFRYYLSFCTSPGTIPC